MFFHGEGISYQHSKFKNKCRSYYFILRRAGSVAVVRIHRIFLGFRHVQ